MKVSVQYLIAGTNASEITASIEKHIVAARIPGGAALPPVRTLATFLGVSPATVASAYKSLQARGILSAQGRNGTKVSLRPPLPIRPSDQIAAHLHNLAEGNPDPALLPQLKSVFQQLDGQPGLYSGPPNRPSLLTLAAKQFESDHIPATHLALMGGALDAIERILQAHLRPGDRVAVEDPGFNEIFDLVGALGLVVIPVAIDECGLLPAALEHVLTNGVHACIFTPRAQNPMGAALDAQRAKALRKVLDPYATVLVIEDDHAGPVAGVSAHTVCHAKKERWAVVRSVSKSLGPDLRLALVTGDATTIARIEGRQRLGAGWVSHILQQCVEILWTTARTEQQLQKAADTYTRRRTALLSALDSHGIPAYGRSGMNVWIPVREEVSVVTGLASQGWAVRAGERYRLSSPPAVRVNISTLTPQEASRLAQGLAHILRPTQHTHSA